jgi:hypothetical protein
MNCESNCDTVQIIEPKGDFLVDTAGSQNDMDERGDLVLAVGQTHAEVAFAVRKLNTEYHFEYLYVDALGNQHPGSVQVIPTIRSIDGFGVVFAGAPIAVGYVLHWRVTIVRTSALIEIDSPEDLYLPIPNNSNVLGVTFVNPRSNISYGFSELRVENLVDPVGTAALIHVQVGFKNTLGFFVGVNPRPRGDNYYLKVRTP